MKILGIDPGTATTGYGLINFINNTFEVLDFGLIETEKETLPSIRLLSIFNQMKSLIKKNKPDIISIERLFFASNAKTAMRVGQAQGVMLLCAASNKVNIIEYAPASIKKIITGDGRADKKVIQQKLRKLLGAKVRSRPFKKTHFDNAADALAVAVCHAFNIMKTEDIDKKGGENND